MAFTFKIAGVRGLGALFDPAPFERATASAINRTLTRYRTDLLDGIKEEYTVDEPKKVLRQRFTTKRASRKTLTGSVTMRSKRRQLIRHTENLEEPGVRVGRGRPAHQVRGLFHARLRSGHEGVFRRRGRSRLPIDEVFTISTSEMGGGQRVFEPVAEKVEANLEKFYGLAFEREVQRIRRAALRRAGRR